MWNAKTAGIRHGAVRVRCTRDSPAKPCGARVSVEWAAFQVLRNPAPPAAAPSFFTSTSFSAAGLSNYTVTVSCTRTPSSGTVSDSATALAFYQLVADARSVPGSGARHNTGTPPLSYVERQHSWTVSR